MLFVSNNGHNNGNNNGHDDYDVTHNIQDEGPIESATLSQRDARSLLLHLLYAAEAFNYEVSLESIADNFGRGFEVHISPQDEVFKKALAIVAEREFLDEQISPLLSNWRLDRLGYTTRLILRIALWEFLRTDIPSSVVINEAVELAKCFAEHDAYKFINGILDEWVKRNRPEDAPLEVQE